MHNTGEILQLCRLCLVKEQVNVPIFEGQGDVKQIFQKISSCLPVKINRSDKLPKNICDGCSEKLDLFYDFWNTSVNSEKQLLEWLGQTPLSAGAGTTIAAKNSKSTDPVQQIKVDVKQEPSDHTDNNESFQADASAVADEDETSFKSESGPPPKRARRAATKRKPITVAPDTDDDDDDDYEPVEPLTKLEDESGNSDNDNEDDSFANAPSTSADDQPGPSGIGKDGVEAPKTSKKKNKNKKKNTCKKEVGDRKLILTLKRKRKKTFYNQDEVDEESMSRVKKEAQIWLCKKCNETYPTRKSLRNHKLIHKKDDFSSLDLPTYKFDHLQDIYICCTCSAEYQDEKDVILHIKTHIVTYTCNECSEEFNCPYKYGIHIASHGDSMEKIFQCPLCSYSTRRTSSLRLHINIVHQRRFFYYCETCGKGFNDVAIFSEHKYEHMGIQPFVCIVCSRSFKYSKYLMAHQERNHTVNIVGQLLPSQCPICLKVLRNKKEGSLERHIKSKHEKKKGPAEKKHLCDTCGKTFAVKEKLNLHYRVHTGFKPYVCAYCPKSFTKKDYLVMHERVHTGEKPYSCEHCGKCFNQTAPLRIHLRTHTGERPYVCQFCAMGFTSRGALNIHLKSCSGSG